VRLWAWEGGVNRSFYEPLAYRRTGPGTAQDGKPKFDLRKFDDAYFKRLRERVTASGHRGIYVSVMLFQGWSLYNHGYGNPWTVHSYNRDNNINQINGDPNGDGEGREVATSIARHSRVKSSPRVRILNFVPPTAASKRKSSDQT